MVNFNHNELLSLLNYDPQTGIFTRNRNKGGSKIGDVAGCIDKLSGYIRFKVKGKNQRANILAWFYMTGDWPNLEVDHINGDKTDNRWENLRLTTHSQNGKNQKHKNKLYKPGVRPMRNKWQARISVDGKSIHIGTFDTEDIAYSAYENARQYYFQEYARINNETF